MIKTNKSHD